MTDNACNIWLIDNSRSRDFFGHDPNFANLAKRHRNIQAIIIKGTNVVGTASTILGKGVANQIMAESTPVQIEIVSSSGSDIDNATTGHAREVRFIGYTEDELLEENVALNGTTDVFSENELITMLSPHVSKHGEGGADAAGNITFKKKPAGTLFHTITATENAGNGNSIQLPENFHAWIHEVSGRVTSLEDISGDVPGAKLNIQTQGLTQYSDKEIDVRRNFGLANSDHENIRLPFKANGKPITYPNPSKAAYHGSDNGLFYFLWAEMVSGQDVDVEYEIILFVWHDDT